MKERGGTDEESELMQGWLCHGTGSDGRKRKKDGMGGREGGRSVGYLSPNIFFLKQRLKNLPWKMKSLLD